MIWIWIFLLIYFVSLAIHSIMCYRENKYAIYKVGDLIDLMDSFAWIPIINTLFIVILILAFLAVVIWESTKLDVLWDKFRNIKLK